MTRSIEVTLHGEPIDIGAQLWTDVLMPIAMSFRDSGPCDGAQLDRAAYVMAGVIGAAYGTLAAHCGTERAERVVSEIVTAVAAIAARSEPGLQ